MGQQQQDTAVIVIGVLQKIRNYWGEDILNGSMGVLWFKKFEIIENCYNKLIMNEL